MQLVLAVFLVLLSVQTYAQPAPTAGYYEPCAKENDASDRQTKALSAARGSNFGSTISKANSCSVKDSEFDPEDDGFDCEEIKSNCPSLYTENEERVKRLKDDAKTEQKELNKELDDELDEQADLKKEAATLSKDYAEREDDFNSDLVTEEKEYKESLREKDKEALQQIHEIQKTIQEIADENRKIVLAANRAMADLARAKLNARSSCREQARKDYQSTLQQLDAALAKRGGKIGGGFEGIQNAENYRKFLVSKIKNPEPSEQFTLCYSAGDGVENSLQQTNMNGALSMNEFSSQIAENNNKRESLTKQLEQQQQLANQQKLEGFQEHQKAIMAIQKKIMTNRQNFEREATALATKQRQVDSKISKLKIDYLKATRMAKNAESRYNCLDNKGLLKSGPSSSVDVEGDLAAATLHLGRVCGTSNTCPVCETYRGEPASGGSKATPKAVK